MCSISAPHMIRFIFSFSTVAAILSWAVTTDWLPSIIVESIVGIIRKNVIGMKNITYTSRPVTPPAKMPFHTLDAVKAGIEALERECTEDEGTLSEKSRLKPNTIAG